MTDEKIIELMQQNKEEGVRKLMEKYLPIVRSVCSEKLQNREDIRECVNDVFAEFCLKYQEYDREKSSLKNYLCMIAKRRSIDRYRNICRKEEIEYKILERYKEELVTRGEQAELSKKLHEAMGKLEPLEKEILEKYYFEGYSYPEIAKKLGMNYEAVKKRGIRGRKKLLYLILVGILVLAITACTTVVLKNQGMLPVWFPFYEWIPEIERDIFKDEEVGQKTNDQVNMIVKNVILKLEENQTLKEEEGCEQEMAQTEEAKKYHVSRSEGIIWSEEDVYEMKSNTQKIQKDDMVYELENVIYQEGKWEVILKITCADTEKVSGIGIEESDTTDEEKIKELEVSEQWQDEEMEYLNQTYLLLPEQRKCYLQGVGWKTAFGEQGIRNIFHYTMKADAELPTENDTVKVLLVLPNGEKFDFVMEKTESKEYVSNLEKQDKDTMEKQEEEILTVGIVESIDGKTIVSLHQKKADEYQVAGRITQDYFGPVGIENQTLLLEDEGGNTYQPLKMNAKDVGEERIFEVYFPELESGEYEIRIPYLCVQKKIKSKVVELPLPYGEEEELACCIPVEFSDGTVFNIEKVKRFGETGYVYNVIGDQVVVEEVQIWMYELEYTTVMENEMIFNVAKATGTTAKQQAVNASIEAAEGRERYVLRTYDSEMSDRMEIQFYEPLYLWEKEIRLNVKLENN